MILLSKNYPDSIKYKNSKVIKIKPLQAIKQQHNPKSNVKNMEDEQIAVETKLNNAQSELIKLQKEQAQLLQDTREQINIEKKNWEQERASYIEQANQEGYKAGFSLGEKEGAAKYEELINVVNGITESAKTEYYSVIEQSEGKILDIAVHIAEEILQQKINENSDSFLSIVKKAIEEIKDSSNILIYLHPKNYTAILQQKTELEQILNGDSNLSIYIDQSIAEDSCIIKHPFGQIDASVHTQLKQIHQAINDVYMESKNDDLD